MGDVATIAVHTPRQRSVIPQRALDAVSITGGIQPRVLRRLLSDEKFADGTAARFMFTLPPVVRYVPQKDGVRAGVGKAYDDVKVFRAAAAYEKLAPWLHDKAHRPAL